MPSNMEKKDIEYPSEKKNCSSKIWELSNSGKNRISEHMSERIG